MDPVVDDPDDLDAVEVEQDVQTLDRMGIAVVRRIGAQVDQTVHEPMAALVLEPEVAGREGIDLDVREVGDAALRHGCDEVGMLRHRLGADQELVDIDRRPRARNLAGRFHRASDQIDDQFGHAFGRRVVDADIGPAAVAGHAARDLRPALRLVRIAQANRLELRGLGPPIPFPDDSGGDPDLRRGQGIEGVCAPFRCRGGIAAVGHRFIPFVRTRQHPGQDLPEQARRQGVSGHGGRAAGGRAAGARPFA